MVVLELVEVQDAIERVVYAFKARKRGNDLDIARTAAELRPFAEVLAGYAGTPEVTQLAFVTLTWDTKACTATEAWERIPAEWNRYTSRLRRRFGDVRILRSFEVTESGYPHVHALVAFHEYGLADLFLHTGKDGIARWRCNDDDRAVLSDWTHPVVDVQAVVGEATARARAADVLWYVAKGQTGGKEIWNRAVMWYLGKRSWSVSGDLRREAREIAPAADDLTVVTCVTQTARPPRRIFLGMVKRVHTELRADEWVKLYPEPPPWVGLIWTPKKMRRRSSVSSFGLAEAFK